MYFSISAFMLGQYTHSQASSFVFSMPMWFVCSWLSTCPLNYLVWWCTCPLSIAPSITASLSLYDQYGCKSGCSSSLVSGQPVIVIPLSCCCCVGQCGTSFFYSYTFRGFCTLCVFVPIMHLAYTIFYSSSGSLFFTHLGSYYVYIYNVQYIYNRPYNIYIIYIYLHHNCTVT